MVVEVDGVEFPGDGARPRGGRRHRRRDPRGAGQVLPAQRIAGIPPVAAAGGAGRAQTGARISHEQIRKNNLEPDGVHRYAVTWLPTFEDRPRRWVIFDVDRIPVPEHMADDWVDEPEAAVEHVLGTAARAVPVRNLLVVDLQLGRGAGAERARSRPRRSSSSSRSGSTAR